MPPVVDFDVDVDDTESQGGSPRPQIEDTKNASMSSITSDSTGSRYDGDKISATVGGLRLSIIFAAQVLLIAALLAGITSYVFVTLRQEVDHNVEHILDHVLKRYESGLRAELSQADRVARRLYTELPYRNLLLSNVSNSMYTRSFAIGDPRLEFFSSFRAALATLIHGSYVYEDVELPIWDSVHSRWMWDEIACAPYACYHTLNNSAAWLNLDLNEGFTPTNFSSTALASTLSVPLQPNVESYVEQIRSIKQHPDGHPSAIWSAPTLWVENGTKSIYILFTRYFCFQWSTRADNNSDPGNTAGDVHCSRSIGVDTDLVALTQTLNLDIASSSRSKTALIHMNSRYLMGTTESGISILNETGVEEILFLFGTSSLTDRIWKAPATPSPMINEAFTRFSEHCVISTEPTPINGVFWNSRVLYKCGNVVYRTGDRTIVGMRLITISDDLQFLLIEMTPHDVFYGTVDEVLTVAVIVVVVVAVFVVVIIAAVFFSVSQSLTNLIKNFKIAEGMEYEQVSTEATLIFEMCVLHEAFTNLNAKLMEARAFLPPSLFQKGAPSSSRRRLSSSKMIQKHNAPIGGSDAAEHAVSSSAGRVQPTSNGGGDVSPETGSPTEAEAFDIFQLPPSGDAKPQDTRAVVRDAPDQSEERDDDDDEVVFNPLVPTDEAAAAAANTPAAAVVVVSPPLNSRKPQAGNIWPRPRKLNLSTALATRRVTVAFANVVAFHNVCQVVGPVEAQRLLGVALGTIADEAAAVRGVVDFFHGDHVMLSFNASTNCTAQGAKCADMMLNVIARLNRIARESEMLVATAEATAAAARLPVSPSSKGGSPRAPLPVRGRAVFTAPKAPPIRVRFGVSTGTAICGNFGTERMRRFCVVSPVVNQAFALMLHTRAEGVDSLVGPASYDIMKDDVLLAHRNLVALTAGSGRTVPSLISTLLKKRVRPLATSGTTRLDDGGGQEAVDDDDTMLDEINQGFECVERGETNEAQQIVNKLEQQLQQAPQMLGGDHAAAMAHNLAALQRLIRVCEGA